MRNAPGVDPHSRAVLEDLANRCDSLGAEHGGIQATPGGEPVDLPDPDGTVLRLYHFTSPAAGFTGVESRDGEFARFSDTPRLSAAV